MNKFISIFLIICAIAAHNQPQPYSWPNNRLDVHNYWKKNNYVDNYYRRNNYGWNNNYQHNMYDNWGWHGLGKTMPQGWQTFRFINYEN